MLTDTGVNDVTHDIIGSAIKVHKALGPGLLESAYAACLAFELAECGRVVEVTKAIPLVYRGIALSVCYYVDILVDGKVVVELKSVDAVAPIHEAQVLTYLRLTGCKVRLLINFNVPVVKDGVHRIVGPAF